MKRSPYAGRRLPRCILPWCLAAGLVWVMPARTHAQTPARSAERTAISGTVRDTTGARIPRATVVIQHDASGFEQVIEAVPDGSFAVGRLAAGRYNVSASAAGFATVVQQIDAPGNVTFVLAPAPIVEQVTVVSASRQEELRDTLNTRVDVISRERIRDSGSQTAGELLRELPGVLSRRNSEGAGTAGEQIQGIDSRQVLVLLDGQPLAGARGIKSGVINLDRQSAARLERIEVVKGASSALYGSDAIGGVINLISRDAVAPLSLNGELSGGSLGEVNAVADAGVRRGRWSALVVGERHRQDGFDLTPTTFDTTAAPFSRIDFLGRVRGQLHSAFSLSALVNGYDAHYGGAANGELGPQENDVDERTLNVNVAADWLAGASTTVQMRAYTARFDENSRARLAPPVSTPLEPGELNERLMKVDGSLSHVIGSRQQVQAGVEFWRDEYSGLNRVRTDSGERATTRVGWAQYRVSAGDRLVATLGARVDGHSEFGSAFSPKIAANARLVDGLSLRASLGRGFRAPDVGQLFYRFLNPSNLYQVIGNPNLTPEYATSLQVGAEYSTPGRRARAGINVFRNDVRDMINSVSLGFVATPAQLADLLQREGLDPTFRPVTGRLFFTYKNVAKAVTSGVELDGEVAVLRGLSLGGAYTKLDARDEVTKLALTGRHDHQGHLRLAWNVERIGLRANVRGTFYSSWITARATVDGVAQDTRAPRFSLWDAFASQRLGRGLSAFAAVDNIADSQDPNTGVVTSTGAPASLARLDAGRTVRAGVRVSWNK
jgi:outer membrane receptor for ferrienterochelin and colicins